MTCTTAATARAHRSSLALLFAAALAFVGSGREDERTAAAIAAMHVTTDDVIAVLKDKALPREQRISKIEAIAVDRFDFPLMTQLVLGKNKNALTPEQLQQFQEEFKQHLSLTYSKEVDRYTSTEKIDIGDGRPESNGDVTVRTHVVGGSAGEGLQIDYRLRQKQDRWLIIDVIPEGVSLVQNFRAQVQDIVSQKGVASLIDTLHQKNAERQQQSASAH